MKIFKKEIDIRTSKRIEFIDVTDKISQIVRESKILDGICYVFVPHTTAAITINENADRSVTRDIIEKLRKLIPQDDDFEHIEGNSDAHIKASLIGVSLNIFVSKNELSLGTWQGIFFCEFDGPRNRKLWVEVMGE